MSTTASPTDGPSAPWSFDDEAGPVRLREALDRHGHAVCRAPGLLDAAERDPWAVARRLHGGDVILVEAHPIRPVPHGRSFASTSRFTPLHTDSQCHRGVPPRLQIMLCARPAAEGGQTLLVDTWPLLERIHAEDPALFDALLGRPRRMRFVFGDVVGPTVSLRGGGVVFTHSPMTLGDALERRLAPWLDRAPRIELRPAADEVMIVDNHRMLHGRRAFEDEQRRFLRLLVWTGTPAAAPRRLHEAVAAVHDRLARTLAAQPTPVREALLGTPSTPDPEPERRLGIVLEMLRGASPGVLSRRHGVPEPELYRWRDAVLRAAEDALADPTPAEEHRAALDRLCGALDRDRR